MEIKARKINNIIVLDLAGKIDANSATFIEIIGQCVHDGYTDILCNLESVDFIDYTGVSAIVIAYKEVVNNKGRMKFAHIPAHLTKIFSVAGLDQIMDIHATEESALNSFEEGQTLEKISKLQLRRRFKRMPLGIKIEARAKNNKDYPVFIGSLLNLSGIGAYIYGNHDFKIEDELTLGLKFSPKDTEITIEAQVVWLPDKQIQHQIYPGMGVIFHKISSSDQRKLLEFIDKNLTHSDTDTA
ncbi:MAG: anti-sigma factor antagonist [Candidatus Omnitrophota bacterium]